LATMPPSAGALLPLDDEPLLPLLLEPLLLPLPLLVPVDDEPLLPDVSPLLVSPLVLEPLLVLPLLVSPLSLPNPVPELPPLQPMALAQASTQIPMIVSIFIVPSLDGDYAGVAVDLWRSGGQYDHRPRMISCLSGTRRPNDLAFRHTWCRQHA
jgi:hypothetical protein